MPDERDDQMREELEAVLRAAAELPTEDQSYLADIFIRHLHERYDITPHRGTRRPRRVHTTALGSRARRHARSTRRSLAMSVAALCLVVATAVGGILSFKTGSTPASNRYPSGLQPLNGEAMTYPSQHAFNRDLTRQHGWGYTVGVECAVKPTAIRVLYVQRGIHLNRTTIHWWQQRRCQVG